jgi:short-subunit dehydrogenase
MVERDIDQIRLVRTEARLSYYRDRIILITGASSGIGEFLAREMVRRGARVGLLARREDKLRELSDELCAERGGAAAWAAADVADAPALGDALDHLADELGGVDTVIANAGYGHPEPPHRFAPGSAEQMYQVNLFGMLRLFDWALPRFLERKDGHLVAVASMASYLGLPNSPSYCGSKAAMRVHMQSLRVSLAPYGVAATTICPGFVESELTAKNKTPMPFLWPTDRAVRLIADRIAARAGEVTFPWQMSAIIGLLDRLPTAMAEWILSRGRPKPKPYLGAADPG